MKTPLTPTDASFYHLDLPSNHQTIGLLCPLASIPDIELLKQRIYNLPTSFPKMGCTVENHGNLYWVSDHKLDPSKHFETIYFPDLTNHSSFLEEISKQFSKPLDLSRPLWRFTIITNQLPNQDTSSKENLFCALLFCAHHALCDGLRGVEIFNTLTDNFSEVNQNKAINKINNYQINLFSSIKRILVEAFSKPVKSIINGTNSDTRSIITFSIPVVTIKSITKKNNVSFNDTLLTIVTGALRSYHQLMNTKPQNIPALIPFNIQRHKNNTLGNHLGGIGLPLPITIGRPEDQLKTISQTINHLKRTGAFGAYTLLSRITSTLPLSLYHKLARFQFSRTGFICSNIQGVKSKQTLAGAPVMGSYGIPALLHRHGLAFCFLTYTDQICVTVVTDPNIISSAKTIGNFIIQTLDQLARLNALDQDLVQDIF